jgi:DNA mismatch repair protein MutS
MKLREEISAVKEFKPSITKLYQIGYMLKCYYELYSNSEYECALKYSVGFEGYLNNLLGVYSNYSNGIVNFATFASQDESKCEFKKQYYPPLLHENHVKNDCDFDKNIIISAPNKSGKTTILKTTSINIIFSQQVGLGFFETATLSPYTHIHSYLNIPDTSGRDSLFQAESRRCKEIIDIINENSDPTKYRHFGIFDELYSGTNPEEATKAGYALLKYLSNYSNVNFILTTHYISICKKFKNSKTIQNHKMEVTVLENGEFVYTYKLKRGISKIKGGVRVLKDMDYPKEIIDSIEKY